MPSRCLGYGRAVYESWHVADLLDPAHYASFVGLLRADNLVQGRTQALLKESGCKSVKSPRRCTPQQTAS